MSKRSRMGRDPGEVSAAELADGMGFAYARVQSCTSRAVVYCHVFCYHTLSATRAALCTSSQEAKVSRVACVEVPRNSCNVLIIQALARLGSDN